MSLYLAVFIFYCFRESLSLFTCTTHKDSGAYLARFLVVIRNSLHCIKYTTCCKIFSVDMFWKVRFELQSWGGNIRCGLSGQRIIGILRKYHDYREPPNLEKQTCLKIPHSHITVLCDTLLSDMSISMKNNPQQNDLCAQRRLRPAWAYVQSDQSLRCELHG